MYYKAYFSLDYEVDPCGRSLPFPTIDLMEKFFKKYPKYIHAKTKAYAGFPSDRQLLYKAPDGYSYAFSSANERPTWKPIWDKMITYPGVITPEMEAYYD